MSINQISDLVFTVQTMMQSKTIDFLSIDFALLNQINNHVRDEAIALISLVLRLKIPKRDSTKTSRDARFAVRFGSPPRIEIQGAKLNSYEAREHSQTVVDIFSEIAESILKRPLTEKERYGNALIAESKVKA